MQLIAILIVAPLFAKYFSLFVLGVAPIVILRWCFRQRLTNQAAEREIGSQAWRLQGDPRGMCSESFTTPM